MRTVLKKEITEIAGSSEDRLARFAATLRELRQRSGLTRNELAELVNYSSEHITKMERGVRLPSSPLLRTLIEVLGKSGRCDPAVLKQLEDLFAECKLAGNSIPVDLKPAMVEVPDNTVAGFSWPLATPLFSRPALCHELFELYSKSLRSRVGAIIGLGGCGKTMLAAEIARLLNEQTNYPVLWQSAQREILQSGLIEVNPLQSSWLKFSPGLTFEALLDGLAFDLKRLELLSGTVTLEEKLVALGQEFKRQPYFIVVDSLENCHNPARIITYLAQMLQNTPTHLLITSRQPPAFSDSYNLYLSSFSLSETEAFVQHLVNLYNLRSLQGFDVETLEVLHRLVEETDGHPLLIRTILRQLELFPLNIILDELQNATQEKIRLREGLNGGIYSYIYRSAWQNLNRVAQQFLLSLKGCSDWYEAEQLLRLFEKLRLGEVSFSSILGELANNSLLRVEGRFQKRYQLDSLTLRFLNSGLPELWQTKGLRL